MPIDLCRYPAQRKHAPFEGRETHWITFLIEHTIEACIPTSWTPVPWGATLTYHDVVFVFELSRAVGEDVFSDMLPHSRPLLLLVKRRFMSILQSSSL